MRRAAAVLALCWAAAVVWAVAGRPYWQHGPAPAGHVPAMAAASGPPPAGRPSPLDAARREAAADSLGSHVGADGALGGCRPEPVSVSWDGPDRAVVELDCVAVLALAGGAHVPVAQTWRIALVWQHDRWVAASLR